MYETHPLANIVPLADEKEQIALTEDIKSNKQQEPAVLWKGEIVDGRCRQIACQALGIKLKTRKLDDNLSHEQVGQIVKSLNTRRNLTDTQKAMSAYIQQEKKWETNAVVAKKWGLSLGSYKNARYLAINKPEVIKDLFDGNSVSMYDPDKGYVVTTTKINTLARIVKKMIEADVVEDISGRPVIEWSADASINTEAGKAWFYNMMKIRDIAESNMAIRGDYIEYANLKFKKE